MNINTFKYEVEGLQWIYMHGTIGHEDPLTYLLPYKEPCAWGEPDLRNAEVLNFGFINDRGGAPWWGQIRHQTDSVQYHPLILELTGDSVHGTWRHKASTPPGRPGNPMTILIDRDGEIVPNLIFPIRSQAKVLFLRHDWESWGWGLIHPAVALQFLEGKCESSKLAIMKWQGYLMRNRC